MNNTIVTNTTVAAATSAAATAFANSTGLTGYNQSHPKSCGVFCSVGDFVKSAVKSKLQSFASGFHTSSLFENLGTALNFAGGIVSLGAMFGCAACAAVGMGLSLASAGAYALAGDKAGAVNALGAAAVSFFGGALAAKIVEVGGTASRVAVVSSMAIKATTYLETKNICGFEAGCGTM
ncbi:hypothetical protein [Streptacidiphilus albus]|uniref:hypothetical protein n=1 Tax=Streptacidiphilus albus TaxID=105425 RepID=UPI00128C50B0|nr:hypothetical protein [Streptacidiphilus albus]